MEKLNLPVTASSLKFKNFRKLNSYNFNEEIQSILELPDESLACWSEEELNIIKYCPETKKIEQVKNIYCETQKIFPLLSPILNHDKPNTNNFNIIFPKFNYYFRL